MPNSTYITGPYMVIVEGAGFSSWAGFTTAANAYAEANRVRKIAETGKLVAFTNSFGVGGNHLVTGIRIFRWNPLVEATRAHARSWALTNTRPDALTPLPADWHLELEPLPDNWFE